MTISDRFKMKVEGLALEMMGNLWIRGKAMEKSWISRGRK